MEETVIREIKKWSLFNSKLFVLNRSIQVCYERLTNTDYKIRIKSFNKLHYLKMLKTYLHLKIYYDNIKKLSSSDERLLKYLETVLKQRNYNLNIYNKE